MLADVVVIVDWEVVAEVEVALLALEDATVDVLVVVTVLDVVRVSVVVLP
jgi:hypothetical protein